jgi:hypothetical protein
MLSTGDRVNLRLVDWIWHVRGSLPLPPGHGGDAAFDRLAPLFRETGTTHERIGDTLTFRKKGQAAQDRMSVFDGGTLRIERGAAGPVLRYHLISRALLFCFLMPFVFLSVAQLTIVLGTFAKPPAHSSHKPEKPPVQLNPIDKALGAPEPERKKDDADKPARRGKKPTPTPAYVFAGIFAVLYIVGRVLEDRLVKGLFRRALLG